MGEMVQIVQIYQDQDLRRGEIALMKYAHFNQGGLHMGQVVLFMNRRRNILKIVGNHGMLTERLSGKQTWDFTLRKDQLLQTIGRAFRMEWGLTDTIYKRQKHYQKN